MNKQTNNNLQDEVEKKYIKKEKRKRKNMKTSGAGVKNLNKIIHDKAHKE